MNQPQSSRRDFILATESLYRPAAQPAAPVSPAADGASCCGPVPIGLNGDSCSPANETPAASCCGTADAAEPTSISNLAPLPKPAVPSACESSLPVAIIGAGPIGLAAAANLVERGQKFVILEAGSQVAAGIRSWGHVRLFTPWSYLIDPAGQRLLETESTWQQPEGAYVPYAAEFVETFLDPLAAHSGIAPHIRLNHKVVSVSREGHDRMKDGRRNAASFMIVTETPAGAQRFYARAVIDASGTLNDPNPMGAGGIPADGEQQFQANIRYGMPDILGIDRDRYAGKRVLVVGSGHSATGNVLSLVELAKASPTTLVAWAVRRNNPAKLWGGGSADEIAERGALGTRVKQAVEDGSVSLLTGLSIGAVEQHGDGLAVSDLQGNPQVVVDEIIVSAGSRPNLAMLRELRLELDPATEATKTLGPLIDPNRHSCGSVPPHGAAELRHPETGFYVAGMKSYGRAPTFLMMTGYEQVRSIVAELAGDLKAARDVHLELPSTGVCSTDLAFQDDAAPSCGNSSGQVGVSN
ncbi:FAD-dependent oxidoreductase [Rosistilla carotiformis]|uniref:FAD-dependent oxidoreductase n=1 Tax=Rosistilla carotiformis TaxID=2528017 RepID=A0A518JR32_9BACT|nr:FAD-dependent oxidoreductase [Rosistilla carotiformis]QDV67999.1 FAD-dependent oxidoreductase [Rosistilla carotiformis]